MKRLLFCLVSICFFVACSSTKNISTTSNRNGNTTETVSEEGTSYENAIVIKEQTERAGVDAEYLWLTQRYPGCKTKGQALNFYKKKPYDIITIITKTGEEKKVYFNISNFYGKL